MTDVSLCYNVHVPCSIHTRKGCLGIKQNLRQTSQSHKKMNRHDIRLVLPLFDDGLKLHFLLGTQ